MSRYSSPSRGVAPLRFGITIATVGSGRLHLQRVFSGADVSPLRVCIDARLRQRAVRRRRAGRDRDRRRPLLPRGRGGGVPLPGPSWRGGLDPSPHRRPLPPASTRAGRDRSGGPARTPGRSGSASRRSARGSRSASPTGPLERAGADLIHFPIQDAFLTELPSIYQPHDLQHLHFPEHFGRWQLRRRERIYRTHCDRAEMVVAMTSWGKRDLIEQYGLPDDKVRVIPWGSVLWEYPEPTAAGPRAPEVAAHPSRPVPALPGPSVAPQEPRGPARGARADQDEGGPRGAPGLSRKAQPPSRRIEQRLRDLDLAETTTFPGFVSPLELRGLYELATALVYPSRFEGWGLPVWEAFSAGLPVASSSATSLPDLVDGAGLLFDPDDHRADRRAGARALA